jgi:hypothetical protein
METNRFKQNIYDEFDANCYKVFGVSGTRVHEVLSERGDDSYEVFEQAFDHGGAAFMRLKMLMSIARLEMVYYETKIGRELSQDEMDERFEGLGIGLNADTIAEYRNLYHSQLEEAERQEEVAKQ